MLFPKNIRGEKCPVDLRLPRLNGHDLLITKEILCTKFRENVINVTVVVPPIRKYLIFLV